MTRNNRLLSILLSIIFAVSLPSYTAFALPEDDAVYDPSNSLNDVRNQGGDNVSYAFVTMALAEISLDNNGFSSEDLSEQYMRYAASKDGSNTLGFSHAYNAAPSANAAGRAAIAAYLQRGNMGGLVVEADDPYIAGGGVRQAAVTSSKTPVYRIGDVIYFDDMPAKATDGERGARISQLKGAIEEYGAVGGWIYSSQVSAAASASTSYWFNDKTLYKFTATNKTANWCVALVGWDDTYDDGNGAFIARNSWGDSAHGAEDDKTGYFYLSYLDYFLLRSAFAVDNPQHLGDSLIDAVYEHDAFGQSAAYPVPSAASSSMAANIFTVTEDNQTARFISFAVPQNNISYTAYLFNLSSSDELKNISESDIVASGVISNAGYYTVALPYDGIELGNTGDKFAVVVKFNGVTAVPVEQKNATNQASAAAGQSFISANGDSWTDISGSGMNACIKLLVESDIVRPTGITLLESAATVEIGSTYPLSATVSGGDEDNAPSQEVIWTSSDTKIATVDSNGVVTAKKAGNCTITARSVIGGLKAECAVWVPEIEVESVDVTPETLTIKTNATSKLTAKCLPSNASDLSVVWTVANYGDSVGSEIDVATISSLGVVKGLAPGTAIITATSKITEGVSDTCIVTVEKDYVTGLSIDRKALTLAVGSTVPIKLAVAPSTAYNQEVEWTMTPADSEVATLDNGVITALKTGTVVFTATAVDPNPEATAPITASVSVTVSRQADYYCTVNKTISFKPSITASEITASVYLLGDNDDDDAVGTEATEEAIKVTATKSTVKVQGKQIGKYRIVLTDTANENNTQVIRVYVKTAVTKVTSYMEGDEEKKKVRRTELTVDQGGGNPGSVQLYAALLPEDATFKDVIWKSSKPAVATVDENGRVTAVAPGSTVISCTSASDGKKNTFSINVKLNSTTLTLNKEGQQLIDIRRSVSVKATVDKLKDVSKTIVWTTSDPSIATVKNGKITAVSNGTVTVTASTLGGLKKELEVRCEVLPTKVNVDTKKFQLVPDTGTAKITASVLPATATETTLSYESRDPTIAEVDSDGNITAGRAGTTTITVSTQNKKTVKVTVIVK